MSYASLQQMLDRVDMSTLHQLTIDRAITADQPATVEELAQRDQRIQLALDDASAELLALIEQLPIASRPAAETKVLHCVRVALQILSVRRPGGEWTAIRKAYDDTIAFYTRIIDAARLAGEAPSALVGAGCSPAKVFTDAALKGLA